MSVVVFLGVVASLLATASLVSMWLDYAAIKQEDPLEWRAICHAFSRSADLNIRHQARVAIVLWAATGVLAFV